MELLIVICLILIIILLLQDKVTIQRPVNNTSKPLTKKQRDNDIMGRSRLPERAVQPVRVTEEAYEEPTVDVNGNDQYGEDSFLKQPPVNIEDELPDPRQEWDSYEYPATDDDFSSAVTYNEISTTANVLKAPQSSDESSQQVAARTLHKIKGTELLSLMESSMEGVTETVAKLLEQYVPDRAVQISKKNNPGDFDIEEFI